MQRGDKTFSPETAWPASAVPSADELPNPPQTT